MPLDRLGLSGTPAQVYRHLVRHPDHSVADVAAALAISPARVRTAQRTLSEHSLLRPARDGRDRLLPVRPDIALGPLLDREQAELAHRQEELTRARAELADVVEDYLAGAERISRDVEVEVVEGLPAIRRRIDDLVAGVQRELMSVATGTDEDADESQVAEARAQDLPLLERGVRMRSILPRASRDVAFIMAYAAETAVKGEELRIADDLPARMLILDREAVVVPLDPEEPALGGLVIWSRAIVGGFVNLFEECWARATPIFDSPRGADDLDPRRRRLLDLLAAGAKDETLARHLRVSVRTVRRDVSELLEELAADTRFQAGVAAARRGWV